MPYVKTSDDTQIFVKEWGQGHPVVLIHGWPLNADSFDDMAYGLAQNGFRAIAYDRRGFGRSDQPPVGYDYDTFADDLAAVIDAAAGDQKVALVGFSMGGGEVARYLSKHGSSKVSHAVLLASVVPFIGKTDDNPDGVPASVLEDMRTQILADRPAFLQTFAKLFYGVGFIDKNVSQGVLDASFNMATMAGLGPTLGAMNAFGTTDFRPDLRAFDVPTLVVHGTADKNVPIDPTGRAAAASIPGATLIEYDGEPHGILATKKDQVLTDVVAFLRGELSGRRDEAPQTIRAEPSMAPTY